MDASDDPCPLDGPIELDLHGELSGQPIKLLAAQLTELAEASRPQVRLDLTEVSHISVRAQVLLLAVARSMRLRGGELVFYGPRRALRSEGSRVDLFNRVRTIDPP